jgi:antitoxin component YwqK of YwqJK toxin-antitoxin module
MIKKIQTCLALILLLVVHLSTFSQSLRGVKVLADSSQYACDLNDLCRFEIDSKVEMLVQKSSDSNTYLAFASKGEITGSSMNFNANGNVLSITGYYLGCPDGLEIGFYPNGIMEYYGYNVCLGLENIREELWRTNIDTGESEMVITERPNTVQHGIWRYFNEIGELEKTETWDMGVLLR